MGKGTRPSNTVRTLQYCKVSFPDLFHWRALSKCFSLHRARMRKAIAVCRVRHQNLELITTTKGLNTSGHHSNNDNSDNLVHGIPEGG